MTLLVIIDVLGMIKKGKIKQIPVSFTLYTIIMN